MKTLYIGDVHCKPSNIEEAQDLIDFALVIASDNSVSKVVFLGDLYDTHAIIRQEVNVFWTKNLDVFNLLEKPIIVLVGNHDQIHVKEKETEIYSLFTLKDKIKNVNIVNDHFVSGKYIYHAYTHDSNKLINNCKNAIGTTTLIAHANFTQELFGDMINPDLIPQTSIISGHVHSNKLSQGKVFYAGSPMWMTATDAGEEKGIWLISDDTGEKEFLPTKEVVQPMYRVTIKEGEEIPEFPSNAKMAFELIGKSSWIANIKKQLKGKGSIKAVPIDRKHVKTDGSKLLNINEYALNNFTPLVGISVLEITEYIGGIDVI